MTLTQITFFFLLIISAVAIAMVVHSWLDKRRIRRSLLVLTDHLLGTLSQEHGLDYPKFSGTYEDRKCDLFFSVVKVGRKHILYYIYNLQAAISYDLLLIKPHYFKPIQDPSDFSGRCGTKLSELLPHYHAYSHRPSEIAPLYTSTEWKQHLKTLDGFTTLQFGPDALVIGKPYDGDTDVNVPHILRNLSTLHKIASEMERNP